MRINNLACGIMCFIILGSSEMVFADVSFETVKHGKHFLLFGSPISIDQVIENPNEIIKDNNCYYTFKLIINRPSGDNGWGISQYNGPAGNISARLYYWAATLDTNPYFYLYSDKDVYQEPHSNPRKVVVHLLNGLTPGKYKIVVGIIPYPVYKDYDVRKMIKLYRKGFVSWLKDLKTIATAVSPLTGVLTLLGGKITDETIDAVIRVMAKEYGQIINLEVLATMPNISNKSGNKAANMLRIRKLVPKPDYSNFIYTKNQNLNGMVAKQEFGPGTKVRAGTDVRYKLYKYAAQQVEPQPINIPTRRCQQVCVKQVVKWHNVSDGRHGLCEGGVPRSSGPGIKPPKCERVVKCEKSETRCR